MRIISLIAAAAGILGLGNISARAADFNGDGTDEIAVFRPAEGKWSARNVTRVYFGGSGDVPVPVDLKGNGTDAPATFRASDGLWAVRNVTRAYFGGAGDIPLGKGGADPATRAYDYVVRADDGADLLRALESTSYRSVFVPIGTYIVSDVINVAYVRHIVGEGNWASIDFTGDNFLNVGCEGCTLENIRVRYGGRTYYGNFYVEADNVTIRNCRSVESLEDAFRCSEDSDQVSYFDCLAKDAAQYGFIAHLGNPTVRYANCLADSCLLAGFMHCQNLSGCVVEGANISSYGFYTCSRVSSCQASDVTNTGFSNCTGVSACSVDGNAHTTYGFSGCANLSSCHVENCTGVEYYVCSWKNSTSCD
jgi:hypothetical protein